MDCFLGQITLFACQFAPVNWALCQGQLIAIRQNTALFSLLGTQFGGDGVQTFGLPDLRGRLPNGMGTGSGLSPYRIGGKGGTESVILSAANIPPHSHALLAITDAATTTAPNNARPALGPSSGQHEHRTATNLYNSAAPNVTLSSNQVSAVAGDGRAHNNIQPVLAMNWCIALTGIFPPRS